MRIYLAYGTVVLIWSTTPLGISISNHDFGFMGAICWRMTLGVVIAYCILRLRGERLALRAHWQSYALAGMGIFPSMALVYWSAQWVPSGLISVMFAASPFCVGLLSYFLLQQESLTVSKVTGIGCAFVGLVIIFYDQISVGQDAIWGLLALLLAISLFALSVVGLKRWGSALSPMQQATGAMAYALPGLWVSWWLLDGTLPAWQWSASSAAVVYLAVMGSVVGFALYYFLLQNLTATTVSLIGMITPPLALMLGAFLAEEQVGSRLYVGAALIVTGLCWYQGLLSAWLKRGRIV